MTISARRGRKRLTPIDRQQRADFVLARLRGGFSFLETQRQFSEKFGYKTESARLWLNKICQEITNSDDPAKRRRVYVQIVEIYHSQIATYQNELLALQRQIDLATASNERRKELLLMLPKAPQKEIEEIRAVLATLPETSPASVVGMLESKSRVRERLCRIVSDLARLQSVGPTGNWKNALNTLLDAGMVPPELAERILELLGDFEFKMRSIGQNSQSHQ